MRVSANRLIKQGEEFIKDGEKHADGLALPKNENVTNAASRPVVEVDDTDEMTVTSIDRAEEEDLDKNINDSTKTVENEEQEQVEENTTLDESTVRTEEGKRKRCALREEDGSTNK